jgi:hypothetical protein
MISHLCIELLSVNVSPNGPTPKLLVWSKDSGGRENGIVYNLDLGALIEIADAQTFSFESKLASVETQKAIDKAMRK